MFLLALDTATPVISVALVRNGLVVAEASYGEVGGPQMHGERLVPLIAEVMSGFAFTELDGIAVGTGPGPYTGLRVGLVTAEVLAAVAGIPVFGVSSLDAIAHGERRKGADGLISVGIDVKRKEYAVSMYDEHDRAVSGPELVPVDIARATVVPQVTPHAADIALVAIVRAFRGDDQPVVPLYLRHPDATVSTSKKSTVQR
jgi:tRNA threonylcarbamoyladenosine biosynthesis protein TsaB